MKPEELKVKRILVVGAGVTGLSVMRYLQNHNIAFDVVDAKPSLPEAAQSLIGSGVYIANLDAVDPCQYDVMVLSPGIPRAHPMLVKALQCGVHVLGDVELFAAVVDGDVVAITGSNGKSTVASMAAHVLACSGRDVQLCGNIGTAVLDVLSERRTNAAPIYVLELSSYQLESTRGLNPLSATVLNISDDHLDRYDSIEDYASVKRSIYDRAQLRVINFDDSKTHPENSAGHDLWFSLLDTAAQYHVAEHIGKPALFHADKFIMTIDDLPLPGLHNAANALAVLALLQPFEIDTKQLAEGLSSFNGLAHRTEFILERQGVRWFNDSKGTNVDACIKAIVAMPGPVVLIAGGQGKGVDFSPLRDVVKARVKALVLMGEDAPLIRQALTNTTDIHDVDSIAAAVTLAAELSVDGDVVLLSPACASFDMFDNYMARGFAFRDSVEQLAA